MSPSAANIIQKLPFFGQTDHDIELTFGRAKAQIRYKMDTNGFPDFIKDDKLSSLRNPYNAMQCEYYNEDEFSRNQRRCKQTLHIISLNIRSLPKHGGELHVFLEALEINVYIIVLSEIGARNIGAVEHLFALSRLSLCTPRDNYFGGVSIYIHKDIFGVQIMDEVGIQKSCRSKCVIESLFIKCAYCSKSHILGGIYRHPTVTLSFPNIFRKCINENRWLVYSHYTRRHKYRPYQVQFRRQLPICAHYYVVRLPALYNFTNTHHWFLCDLDRPHIHSRSL